MSSLYIDNSSTVIDVSSEKYSGSTVEKFTVRMAKVRLALETPGLQMQCSSL